MAQSYPVKPIRLIVPYPPGGGTDIFARMLGARLGEALGQQIVIDNRAGAAGVLGADAAAKAAPDGYTLVVGQASNLAINPHLMSKLPYDPVKDFAPITLIATSPSLLVVHPSLPVRSVKDLVALAKAQPGAINYASAGNGSPGHLAAEYFKKLTKIDLVHIPYKGATPAMLGRDRGTGFAVFHVARRGATVRAVRDACARSQSRARDVFRLCPTYRRSRKPATANST